MSSQPLVIAFADSSYLPLLDVWVRRIEALRIERVRIYGLDAATSEWCAARGVDVSEVRWSGDLRDLWLQRIGLFSGLIASGEEFIHSDIDAIWLKNPLETGSARGCTEDLLFSQGTVWPPDVHDRWGFVLCCGWFRAKPTRAVRDFFQALEADVRKTGDDQISVNRLLAALGAEWSHGRSGDYQLAFGDRMVQCWAEPVRASVAAGLLSVTLLPHREFQRLPEASDHAVVKHLLTPKNCSQKMIALRGYGLI